MSTLDVLTLAKALITSESICFADLSALFLFEQLMQAHTSRISISLGVKCLEPNYRGERNVDTQYFFQLTTPILHMK